MMANSTDIHMRHTRYRQPIRCDSADVCGSHDAIRPNASAEDGGTAEAEACRNEARGQDGARSEDQGQDDAQSEDQERKPGGQDGALPDPDGSQDQDQDGSPCQGLRGASRM